MSVELTDKGGRYAALGMSNDTQFTLLDTSGVEAPFGTCKTNDPTDRTCLKARKLAGLIETQELPGHWSSDIGKPEGRTFLIASLRNCKGSRIY